MLAVVAMLGDTTLERFVSTVGCGCVARVEAVVELSESTARSRHRLGEEYFDFVTLATFSVLDTFGSEECKDIPMRLEVFFSTEVHSSHPIRSQTVVLFPRREGEEWMEAVYGRSYWILSKGEQGWDVEVNWRNEFLVEPLHLQAMETATVPLSAVIRVFEESK